MAVAPYNSSVIASSASTSDLEETRSGGVTFRVVCLCLALAVFFGYIIPIIDVKVHNTFLGAAHLPPGAVAVLLFVLLVLNPLLKMVSRRFALARNEVLTVYISCLFSCLVPGHGAENFFVSNIIGPFYFAKAENKWLDFLNTTNLKPWFTPALQHGPYSSNGGVAHDAINGWYNGINVGSETIPWGLWLTPLLMWGALVFAIYLMFACLSVILRAQWSDREALAFPLLRLPTDLTEDVDRNDKFGTVGRLLRNPLLWIGVSVAVFIQLLNGLHNYVPSVPAFPLEITGNFFSEKPWDQIGWTPIKIWPIVIGITFLLTSEISFSLWFFYWFMKFQNVVGYYSGYPTDTMPNPISGTGKAFASYQTVGAFLMYAFLILWTGREHYRHVARRAFGRARKGDEERGEALSYPVAFWGFVLSFAFLVGWCIFAGINPVLAFLMWMMYLVIAVGLSRVVIEGGLLFVQQGWTPLGAVAQLLGGANTAFLPTSSIVPASFVNSALMVDLRGFILPSFIQSFKLAQDNKIKMKPLLALIMAVTAITLIMGIWMDVRLGYVNGALTLEWWFTQGGAQLPGSNAASLLTGADPKQFGPANWFFLALGALLTFLMMLARSRFLWFPLHPIGYLVSLTYPMNQLWFSIFLGWVAKVTITRFGGSDTYRKTVPLFLGFALGDVLMMLAWLVIDGLMGKTGHQLMPG